MREASGTRQSRAIDGRHGAPRRRGSREFQGQSQPPNLAPSRGPGSRGNSRAAGSLSGPSHHPISRPDRGAPRLRRGAPNDGGLGAISGPPVSKNVHRITRAVRVHVSGGSGAAGDARGGGGAARDAGAGARRSRWNLRCRPLSSRRGARRRARAHRQRVDAGRWLPPAGAGRGPRRVPQPLSPDHASQARGAEGRRLHYPRRSGAVRERARVPDRWLERSAGARGGARASATPRVGSSSGWWRSSAATTASWRSSDISSAPRSGTSLAWSPWLARPACRCSPAINRSIAVRGAGRWPTSSRASARRPISITPGAGSPAAASGSSRAGSRWPGASAICPTRSPPAGSWRCAWPSR